jgi:NAD-dependent deacetylase
MSTLSAELRRLIDRGLAGSGPIVFLTGAGISAESGIPTFRGPEGYWTIGARDYHPQELATREAFETMPNEVWSWYLYRRGVCRRAKPNAAHHALAELEHGFHDRLVIITQNVDGLHLRAGSLPHLTYQIHGNLDLMRHDDAGERQPVPVPDHLDPGWERGRLLSEAELDALRHPSGTLARPHVLWFDEFYDEELFRFESSLEVAEQASLLVVVGSSGATNLPLQVAAAALRRAVPIIVVNRDETTRFASIAARSPFGWFEQGFACDLVPQIAAYMQARGLERIA